MNPFNKILIHVDFSENSYIAIEKGLELCEPSVTQLHLVHIYSASSILHFRWMGFNTHARNAKSYAEEKLCEVVRQVQNKKGNCKVMDVVIETASTVNEAVSTYIQQNGINLVIEGRSVKASNWSDRQLMNVYKINCHTGCPVLSVTAGCLNRTIKSILLPIGPYVPASKIQMALALTQEFNAHLHLLVLIEFGDNSKTNLNAFYSTYKILRECGHNPDYKVVNGFNTLTELYSYAEEIKADLVLVNTEKEAGIFQFLNRHIKNRVQPLSPLHILSLKSIVH